MNMLSPSSIKTLKIMQERFLPDPSCTMQEEWDRFRKEQNQVLVVCITAECSSLGDLLRGTLGMAQLREDTEIHPVVDLTLVN